MGEQIINEHFVCADLRRSRPRSASQSRRARRRPRGPVGPKLVGAGRPGPHRRSEALTRYLDAPAVLFEQVAQVAAQQVAVPCPVLARLRTTPSDASVLHMRKAILLLLLGGCHAPDDSCTSLGERVETLHDKNGVDCGFTPYINDPFAQEIVLCLIDELAACGSAFGEFYAQSPNNNVQTLHWVFIRPKTCDAIVLDMSPPDAPSPSFSEQVCKLIEAAEAPAEFAASGCGEVITSPSCAVSSSAGGK